MLKKMAGNLSKSSVTEHSLMFAFFFLQAFAEASGPARVAA
jgi:hypothetical protein